jgi:hypothetical protein
MGSSRTGPRSEISHTKRPLALPDPEHVRPAAVTARVGEDLVGREEHPVRALAREAGRGQRLCELRAQCARIAVDDQRRQIGRGPGLGGERADDLSGIVAS